MALIIMSTMLGLKLKHLPWLEQNQQEDLAPPLLPLVLLPGDGDGGGAVEVEAALLLACSPLLRRTLSSSNFCCHVNTVMVPSTTPAALAHLVKLLSKGRVTIASDALADLGALLSLLEVDIERTAVVKRPASNEINNNNQKRSKKEGGNELLSAPVKECSSPYGIRGSAPTKLESTEQIFSSSPNLTLYETAGPLQEGLKLSPCPPPPTLLVSIPFARLPSKTVFKINSVGKETSSTSRDLPPELSFTCFFCGLSLSADMKLQHQEVCDFVSFDHNDNNFQVCGAKANVQVHIANPEKLAEGKHERDSNRTEHMLEVEGSAVKRKIYICEYINCGEIFPRPMLLADHQRKAHGAAKLKCQNQECSATFDSRQSQLRHMWVNHGIGEGISCDECGKRETGLRSLEDHRRSAHGAPKLICDRPDCGAAYAYASSLRHHIRLNHS